jgi:four helix bundle protein
MTKGYQDFDLEDRLIDFSVRIITLIESLPKSKVGKHVGGQLLRSGTSPAPNYGEAQGAESRSDFIHKMKICLKELRETRVWLKIIRKTKMIKPESKLKLIIEENNQLISIFVASINTARENKMKTS